MWLLWVLGNLKIWLSWNLHPNRLAMPSSSPFPDFLSFHFFLSSFPPCLPCLLHSNSTLLLTFDAVKCSVFSVSLLFLHSPCLFPFPVSFFSDPLISCSWVSSPPGDRSMIHSWRMWRLLRACRTFVIPSSSTEARLRRKQTIHLSSENLRSVPGLTYNHEVAAISKRGRGSGSSNHGAATGVLGGDLVVDQNWVVVWASLGLGSLIPIVMALRTESNGPIGYCIIDSDDKNENQVPIFFRVSSKFILFQKIQPFPYPQGNSTSWLLRVPRNAWFVFTLFEHLAYNPRTPMAR